MRKAEFWLLMQVAAYSALISDLISRPVMQETVGSPTNSYISHGLSKSLNSNKDLTDLAYQSIMG